jgi:D-3-phosphoglycerate dehydrogenase
MPPGDNRRPRVLVRERIADTGIDLLESRFEVDVDFDGNLAERIAGYDALIVRSATRVTAELIERADRLKVIGRAGVGVDNVDVQAATKRGILVVNAPQSTVVSAAEHTIGLLLAVARSIPQAHAALKAGIWERSRFAGVEVAEKTLGIVGFGRIGQQVARRARGLAMQVVAIDPIVSSERMRELGVERAATLRELLAVSDFVSLHAALTAETRGLIGREELRAAKPGLRIVNVARGELIDEEALLEALRSGQVAGAALDVFSEEPYSGPLLELDSVVTTPHLGASTREAQDRAGIMVAEQVAAALEGRMATNAVNIPAVPPEDAEALGPFLPLAAKLGALAYELAAPNITRFDLCHQGELAEHDTRLLTAAVLNGAFHGHVEEAVNYVNAPLVARERGIAVSEESRRASRDFTNLIQVTAESDGREYVVAGTAMGAENRPRLTHALGYEIEVDLEPLMVFIEHQDAPGRIGLVGTLFGEAGVNIATMGLSRNRPGGNALMALTLDTPLPEEVAERLRQEPGFHHVRVIRIAV